MKLTLLILSLFMVTGSFYAASAALAVEDPATPYCTNRYTRCSASCADYNVTLFGMSFPSVQSIACGIECNLAYAGCMMMRFREGT